MPGKEDHYTFDRVVRIVISAVVLAVVLALLRHLSDVLLPFAVAVVLAYLLNPLVALFERKTKRRGLAVALSLGGLGIAGLAVLAVLLPLVLSQAGRFRDDLEKLRSDLAATTEVNVTPAEQDDAGKAEADADERSQEKTAFGWKELREGWTQYRADPKRDRKERFRLLLDRVSGTYIGEFIERAVQYTKSDEFNELLVSTAKQVAVGGWTVVAFAVNLILGLTGLIIVLLYLVFLLLDYPTYARTWKTFLPPQYRDTIVQFLEEFNVALRRYFRGQAVVAVSVGVLFAVGFSIVGLPMAVPFGLFVGLLNMVPYLQMVGLVPAVLLAGLRAIEGDSSFAASVVLVLLVFAVVQLIQDALITPRVMGKATGLRPVAILLGLFIWGKLLGFLGLLLAIPLTCLGIAYYRRYVLEHAPETVKLT
jgi:predicted PurR-regulated permease PerM